MARLLAEHDDIVVCGTVSNQGAFYNWFAHVILLSAPLEILLDRVRTRTNNPYGHSPEQQAEIAQYVATVEPLLRRGATLELDWRRPVTELGAVIARLVAAPPGCSGRLAW